MKGAANGCKPPGVELRAQALVAQARGVPPLAL